MFGSLGGVSWGGGGESQARQRVTNVQVNVTEHCPKANPADDLSRG